MTRTTHTPAAIQPLAVLALVLGLATPSHADFVTGLQGYYQFNGNGADASGNGRDLSLFGGVGFAPGLFGQALDLHGNNSQFAQRPVNDPVLNFGSGDFTIQVWINYNSLSREQTLIEKLFGGGVPAWSLTTGPGALLFGAISNQFLRADNLSIPNGIWHDVTVRRSGDTFNLFFDGAIVATRTDSSPIGATTSPLLIGRRNAADGRDFSVDGRIDEVAIWNRALTDSELATLYNNGRGFQLATAVPEPSAWLLFAAGGLTLLACGYYRRKPANV